MELYKKILVAVNGSKASLNAMKEAVRISYWMRGSVRVISVVPTYEGDLRFAGVKNIKALLNEPCKNILEKIKEAAEDIGAATEAVCREGEPFEVITGFAETEECDLIVTGVEKKHPIYRTLIGGVTGKFIRSGTRDILVIPDETHIDWNRILVLADCSQEGRIAAVKAIEIAKAYGGELIFPVFRSRSAGATNKNEEYIREIETLSSEIPHKIFPITGNTSEAITDLAVKQQADLIVAGSFRKKSSFDIFSKRAYEKVIYTSPCPVLVVKN